MTDFANLVLKVDSNAVKTGSTELDKLTGAGKRAEGAADRVSNSFAGLRRVFYGLGVAAVTREFLQLADASKKIEAQLKLATAQMGSFYQAQSDVRRISAETRGELDATATLYANFIRNSQALGKGQEDAARATETFTKTMKISGAGAAEAAGATRQFGQALASGVLRGDEFNSVMENAPRLAKLLADSLNTNVGALRAMAAEGELTSDKLYAALTDKKFTAAIDAEFKQMPVTFGEAMQQVTNAATITFGAFDRGGDFSNSVANFILDGTNGFADLEDAAVGFGIKTRAMLDGLYDAFGPFVSSGIDAFDILFDVLGIQIADARTQISQLLADADTLLNIGPSVANVFGADGKYDSRLQQRFEESYAASERAAKGRVGEEFIGNLTRGYDILGNSTRAAPAIVGNATASGSKAKKSDAEKEYEKAVKASEKFLEQLEIERETIGKTQIEIDLMNAKREAGLAPTEELRRAILASAEALANETFAYEAQTAAAKAFLEIDEKNRAAAKQRQEDAESYIKNTVEPLEAQIKLLGLSGPALEKEKLAHEKLNIILNYGVEAWLRYNAAQQAVIADMERTAEVERYTDSIYDLINALDSLGGAGRAIGDALSFLTGVSSVSGPLGALLNITTGTQKDAQSNDIVRKLGDELRDIFKIGGDFGKTMESLLTGAGTGAIAGAAFFGEQNKTEQLGSALGGALGQVAGQAIGKAIGGIAGQLGGPLGAIAGGVLGSLLGGLLSKTPWGRVTLSAQGASNPEGNSGASRRAAVKAGGSFDTALQDIASAFDGAVGDFGNIVLGVRHGDWRVNANGTSLKIKKGAVEFDEDAEGAIAYALQIAIDRGAITGIREATQRLLKSSDNLASNLEKALKFEGVFKELESLKNPLEFALGELTGEFDKLKKIFDEAGASAAEYAQLEELLALKRADIIADENRRAVDKFNDRNSLEVELLQLLGREEDALAAARLNELAATEAALQPLQAMIYQLQDARAIIDQFAPLADDLRAFRKEITGSSTGASGYAVKASEFRSTAALARDGDAGALGNLRSTASEFLDAAKENASSAVEYQRAVGEVLGAIDSGIFAVDSQIEYAQLQIDAVNNSANIIAGMREEMKVYQQQIVENTGYMARLWARFEGDGLTIKTDADTPLQVEVV